MQMLNLSKIIRNLKKSHSLLIGSLLIFIGFVVLTCNYFMKMTDEVYSEMKISMMDVSINNEVKIDDDLKNLIDNNSNNDINDVNTNTNTNIKVEQPVVPVPAPIDYSKYYGVLEIPRISLKRGFYNIDSKYNTIEKNVTMVKGSAMPDVDNGNLILMAHSGDAYISFFAYLYLLGIGDNAFITYNGVKYQYKIVNIYQVEKSGMVLINRNLDKNTLTLITCTKDDDKSQTVYIAELVN